MDSTKRKQLLVSFGSAPDLLENALKVITPKIWTWSPTSDEWNIRQIIFHLTDGEANYYVRMRKAIAEPGGKVVAFDQNKWTDTLAYHDRNADEALELFRLLRTSSHRLLSQIPEVTWGNWVEHSERGKLTLEDLLEGSVNHINEHLEQIEGNVKQFKNR